MNLRSNVILGYLKKASVHKEAAVEREVEVRLKLNELPEQVKTEGKKRTITQGILEKFPEGYIRVRKDSEDGCSFTRKNFKQGIEDNLQISEALFDRIYKLSDSPQEKTRYTWNGWDIDVIPEEDKIVAEFELPKGQVEVEIPEFFSVKEAMSPFKINGNKLTK